MPLTVEDLARLTIAEIFSVVKDFMQVPRPLRRRKDVLIPYVMEHADGPLRGALEEAVRSRTPDQPLKRKRADTQFQTRKAQRATETEQDVHDVSRFLELPSKSSIHGCYEDFYNATSNAALETLVCGICAREVSVQNDGLSTIDIQDLPTRRLTPQVPHPAHVKFRGGMLLEPQGVVDDLVRVCGSCRAELAKDRSLPPKFSLANNLWIGQIPWELKKLTFPEQLLIAHIYPRVFVFKLYPKAMNRVQGPETLQRGMRGTVSSYDLNVDAVTAMVEGKLMPRPLAVLSSLISVTYIGVGKLPKNWLRSTFRVRREAVASALCWLKANNPKYYGDITISSSALEQLPVDDVPDELLSIIRQSEDVGILDQEGAGYVRTDDIGMSSKYLLILPIIDHTISQWMPKTKSVTHPVAQAKGRRGWMARTVLLTPMKGRALKLTLRRSARVSCRTVLWMLPSPSPYIARWGSRRDTPPGVRICRL